jgi:four helix bundle protein
MDSQNLRDRTKNFAIQIIKFVESNKYSLASVIIAKQLLRSATSIASNYRAACRGRSKAEYYSKLSIVVEESDETQFWLELLLDANLCDKKKTEDLYNEATELLKIFSSSRKTFKLNNKL